VAFSDALPYGVLRGETDDMTTSTLHEHPSRPGTRPLSESPPPGVSASRQPPPPRKPRKVLRYVLAIVGLIALIALLGGVKAAQIGMLINFGKEMEKAGPPPEVVSTTSAELQTWEATLSAVASVVSAKGVALANDAAGVVSRLHIESGAEVKQGQVLVELDTKVERAQLNSLRARRELTETSLARSRALVASGAIPQAQLDADESAYKSIVADQAGIEAEISRKVVRAPFSGRLGLRQVNLGQYLAPGTTVAMLESTDSDYIDFTLPQRDLEKLTVGMAVRATEAGVESGDKPVAIDGVISAIDPSIDPVTRAVKVRATVPSKQSQLRPGMFLNVSVILPQKRQVVAVPRTAVVHASYGDSVFVAAPKPKDSPSKAEKVAEQKFVRLGEARGDFVVVDEGLKAGEEVVTSGAFKLRNGLPIIIDNKSVKLDPKLAPKPSNR
jgi:membrane fusion protein (multidrug efflux system)